MNEIDHLDRLAALAGIEDGWWDFFGTWRVVPAETKRAFLAAMGLAAGDAGQVADSLRGLEERPWRRRLEPVVVWSERSGHVRIPLVVRQDQEYASLAWTLREEIGVVHHGEVRPFDLPVTDQRELDGVTVRRHQLTLPGMLPVGIHDFRLDSGEACTVIVAPARAWVPPEIERGGRLWGLATQLYALRGEHDWGLGHYGALAELGRLAGPTGAAAIGVNPLHALFTNRPERYSPYSPSSRVGVTVSCLDIEALADFADSGEARGLVAAPGFQARLAELRNGPLVDYVGFWGLARPVLEACWDNFRRRHLGPPESERGQAFRRFQADGGRAARRFAVFEALQERALADGGSGWWREWPAAWQAPDSPAVAAFARDNSARVEFFWWLQWQADQQLAAAQAACRQAGMPIGLYRDLGVGIADDGADAWGGQELLALGVTIGAPPDPLQLKGQDWGLAPFNPIALKEAAYRPFLEVLTANMRHAGAMRLDHAMSLQRLYWVPRGMAPDQGAYVRYPAEDLFALVAFASRRQRCMVIGEDLGTVPEGFRERMADTGLLAYRLLVFERGEGGTFKPPSAYTAQAATQVGTHDLPSLYGWWQGLDAELRSSLDLYPRPGMEGDDRADRERARPLLVAALAAEGLLPADFPTTAILAEADVRLLATAIHLFLARSPAALLLVQPEDVLGLVSEMNVPGTTDQHPNWRLRLPVTVARLMGDPRMRALAERLTAERAG